MLQGNQKQEDAAAEEYKVKYEGMLKLYQNLRVEHLGALEKWHSVPDYQSLAEENEKANIKVRELEEQLSMVEEQFNSIKINGERDLDDEFGEIERIVNELVSKLSSIECTDTGHFKLKGLSGKLAELIAILIKRATDLQREIELEGDKSKDPKAFYLKNSVWTKGLISAAQAVGSAAVTFGDHRQSVRRRNRHGLSLSHSNCNRSSGRSPGRSIPG